jgi:hypothetical protein
MLRRLASVVALGLGLAFSRPAQAQVIEVPEDYPGVQDAIDAAPAGATIVVHGGTWGAITIDKALTLIGPATFEGASAGSIWSAPITLAGPGAGHVVLSNLSTGKEFVDGSEYYSVSPGITGGGFDALHVYDSSVRAPSFCSFGGGPGCLLTGVGLGRPGIQTSVAEVLIERSLVQGSRSDNDGYGGYPDGPAGIDAPASAVLVFDSTVRGGPAGNYYSYPYGNCATLCFGSGGAAVVAAALYHSRASLVGGAGAAWHGRDDFDDPYVPCPCSGPSGAPATTSVAPVRLHGTLEMPSPPAIGTTLTLIHRGGAGAILLSSTGVGAPTRQPALGYLFLANPSTNLGTIGPGNVGVPIPALTMLIGGELAFQTVELHVGLSRPVSGVIR